MKLYLKDFEKWTMEVQRKQWPSSMSFTLDTPLELILQRQTIRSDVTSEDGRLTSPFVLSNKDVMLNQTIGLMTVAAYAHPTASSPTTFKVLHLLSGTNCKKTILDASSNPELRLTRYAYPTIHGRLETSIFSVATTFSNHGHHKRIVLNIIFASIAKLTFAPFEKCVFWLRHCRLPLIQMSLKIFKKVFQ